METTSRNESILNKESDELLGEGTAGFLLRGKTQKLLAARSSLSWAIFGKMKTMWGTVNMFTLSHEYWQGLITMHISYIYPYLYTKRLSLGTILIIFKVTWLLSGCVSQQCFDQLTIITNVS